MAGEVDKVVQQHQSVASPPVANPRAEESRDVEMSDAPLVKEPEQSVAAPPVDSAELEAHGEASVELPKEPVQGSVQGSVQERVKEPVKESLAAVEAKPENSEPARVANEPTEPAAPSAVVTDVVGSAEKPADATPEKPADAAPEKASANLVEAPVDKAEEAEDASARMLAANLETAANGDAKVDILESEPLAEEVLKNGNGSPATGEKRKADNDVGSNGGSSNKKSNIESAVEPPTTNGGNAPRKPGRPKKEKKAPAPVGKTARRTRSQGAADLGLV